MKHHLVRSLGAAVVLMIACLATVTVCPAQAQTPPDAIPELFQPVTEEENNYIQEEFAFELERFKERSHRMRVVKVNFEALRPYFSSFIFNPFDDVRIPIRYVETDDISPPLSVIWKGRILSDADKVAALERAGDSRSAIAREMQEVSISIMQTEMSGPMRRPPFMAPLSEQEQRALAPPSYRSGSDDIEGSGKSYYPVIVTRLNSAFLPDVYRVTPLEELPGYHLVSETKFEREIKNPHNLSVEERDYLDQRQTKLKRMRAEKEVRDRARREEESRLESFILLSRCFLFSGRFMRMRTQIERLQ